METGPPDPEARRGQMFLNVPTRNFIQKKAQINRNKSQSYSVYNRRTTMDSERPEGGDLMPERNEFVISGELLKKYQDTLPQIQ